MKLPGEFVPWVLSHDVHCRAFLWDNQDQDQWSETPGIIEHQRNRLIHSVIGFIDSLKPGFHMIATIAEKKKFSDRGDHMKIIFIFMIAMIALIAEPIHLVGLNTTRLPVFLRKERGYDWILVDSIWQPSDRNSLPLALRSEHDLYKFGLGLKRPFRSKPNWASNTFNCCT